METILDQIRDFADRAHSEQLRKYTPDRYIVHPVRVMEICRTVTSDTSILAAALLHDVLEDTPVSREEIRRFLQVRMDGPATERTLKLVDELTDVYVKAAYPLWNRKQRKARETERLASTSADSQTIKYADIIDNCSEIVAHDRNFARIFLHECSLILKVMNKGNKDLYRKAVETVDRGLWLLKEKSGPGR